MAIPIPIIIGGVALAGAATTWAATEVLKEDEEQDDGNNHSRSSNSGSSSTNQSRSKSGSTTSGPTKAERKQHQRVSALKSLCQERNEAAQHFASSHGIDLPDKHGGHQQLSPEPLFDALEDHIERRKEELHEPVDEVAHEVDALKELRQQAQSLHR